MKKFICALCLLILTTTHGFGQSHAGQGPTLPPACEFGAQFSKTGANAGPYWCTATNTWTGVPTTTGNVATATALATARTINGVSFNGTANITIEMFPVGSIFMAVVSTNPNTLLGYGTWSAFGAGKVLVGLDGAQTEFDTVEETGGSKTHTLTSAEMPAHTHVQDSHNHTQNSHNHTQDAHSHTVTSVGSAATGSTTNLTGASDTSSTTATAASATATNQAATATNQATTATNQNTGGGGAHNNLQPFIVVYMWKRTA